MSKNNQPDLDTILNWQTHALLDAMFDVDRSGEKPYQIHITDELINKHKEKAKSQILTHYIAKQDAIKAFEKYLDTYHGDYTDKNIERFKLILERIGNE